jgi:hypothetical protein
VKKNEVNEEEVNAAMKDTLPPKDDDDGGGFIWPADEALELSSLVASASGTSVASVAFAEAVVVAALEEGVDVPLFSLVSREDLLAVAACSSFGGNVSFIAAFTSSSFTSFFFTLLVAAATDSPPGESVLLVVSNSSLFSNLLRLPELTHR